MKGVYALAAVSSLIASAHATVHFKETFNDEDWRSRWVDSKWKGDDMGEWEWSAGDFGTGNDLEKGIRTSEDFRFYATSALIDQPFSNKDKDLVVQFSVKHEAYDSSFCGGGYIKLLGKDFKQEEFGGETPYHIMFGPDLCGSGTKRVHLIFNYKDENLLKNEDIPISKAGLDELTHLYTLHVRPDNSYTVYIDNVENSTGLLPEGWNFPSKTIDDPTDSKPSDWVDEATIPDPDHVKPEGYDDIPETISDPDATKPEEWNDEDDGEWEPPIIPNPEYKGEWVQNTMANPDYKGEWVAKQIPNPDYDENAYAYSDIGAVGFELWVVNSGSVFNNIFVGDDLEEAKAFAAETWEPFREAEAAAKVKREEESAAKHEAEMKAAEEEEAAADIDLSAEEQGVKETSEDAIAEEESVEETSEDNKAEEESAKETSDDSQEDSSAEKDEL